MKVAYLVNQYPKVSHAFIRREINALEAGGVEVERCSIRRVGESLADDADLGEAGRTRVILDVGVRGLLAGLASQGLRDPVKLLAAAKRAAALGLASDRGVVRHLAYLAEACVLRQWLLERGCGHLHAHFGTNSTTVAMLCRDLGGPPFSFTVHGPEEFDKPDLIGLRQKIEEAAFVVGVSSYGRSQLLRRCRLDEWAKVEVIRCGVDGSYLASAPDPIPEAPRIVCVGRLCEQKGQLLLVEAAARVVAAGRPLEVVLVGDGEMRREVEALVARHGLERHVTITGWASGSRVMEELRAARALVLPSFAEGLPVVIMEALALGRPVVSTYVAGIPELVAPGKCGWLVPAGSVEALEAAIIEVLDSSTEALARMGEEGRRRVAELHDVDRSAARLRELFAKTAG